MLYFANYSGDADSSIVRETWARLIDQALSRGGIAEACSVLKRVGSHIYPGDGAVLPLDTLCLHLEKAALVHFFRIFWQLHLINSYCKQEYIAFFFFSPCSGTVEALDFCLYVTSLLHLIKCISFGRRDRNQGLNLLEMKMFQELFLLLARVPQNLC